MKSLIFDSGSIISLAMNNLLYTLKPLKQMFNGSFYIGGTVKKEIIDNPLNTKKYRLEAIFISQLLHDSVLELYDNKQISNSIIKIKHLANSIYQTKSQNINILQDGEIESLALNCLLKANAYVVDERTMRLLIENPYQLQRLLSEKLHTRISINKDALSTFNNIVCDVKILRSVELMIVAYENGIFNILSKNKDIDNKQILLGLIWGLKLNGCSISTEEITRILHLEGF